MSAAPAIDTSESEPRVTTLLELVCAISEQSACEEEVVATVRHLLRTGRVRLNGNFRDCAEELLAE